VVLVSPVSGEAEGEAMTNINTTALLAKLREVQKKAELREPDLPGGEA